MNPLDSLEPLSQLVMKIVVPLLDAIIDKSRTATLEELQSYLWGMRLDANNKSLVEETLKASFLQAQKELDNKPQ
jgi:hypothetical protein